MSVEKENLEFRLSVYAECENDCSENWSCYDCGEAIDLANAWE